MATFEAVPVGCLTRVLESFFDVEVRSRYMLVNKKFLEAAQRRRLIHPNGPDARFIKAAVEINLSCFKNGIAVGDRVGPDGRPSFYDCSLGTVEKMVCVTPGNCEVAEFVAHISILSADYVVGQNITLEITYSYQDISLPVLGVVVKVENDKTFVESEVLKGEEALGYVAVDNSWAIEELFKKYQNLPVFEGVCYTDHVVNEKLKCSLLQNIDQYADSQPLDYHPGSNNVVRDILHPGLYCYVGGVSQFIPSVDMIEKSVKAAKRTKASTRGRREPKAASKDTQCDQWGRKYEDSNFQWLPSYIDVSLNGRCKFRNGINNMPRAENEGLYHDLEDLFQHCLPLFEAAVGYGKEVVFYDLEVHENPYDLSEPVEHSVERVSLQGCALQVMCKIVEYEIQPGDEMGAGYEGVWHVEGMSHENIVATAVYTISRDKNIKGGDLMFKRAFTAGEVKEAACGFGDRIPAAGNLMDEGLVPLGKVATKEGRIIVFPNSHVHKVNSMQNLGTGVAKRRIIVFFLINPDVRIISTQEVPNQTERINREDALKYRIELMEERKYHKQDWNVREISLCEH